MSPRAHRIDTLYEGECNGDEADGCEWATPLSGDGFRVKEAAKAHARLERHEVVVTETSMVVYDRRPRR